MPRAVSVLIHQSQFPENVRQDLLESLRSRQINHKFHYDSIKQTQKWLTLHQSYSPSRTDPDCERIYDESFRVAAARLAACQNLHLVGLGCGGGQKDTRLLESLSGQKKKIAYTPSDVSVAMVLVAQQAATSAIAAERCFPFVCDLASSEDISEMFQKEEPNSVRLFTFFGMIPNFEPKAILSKLANLLRSEDLLLFSANLSPGDDYSAGMQKILPLYDNNLTRDWLQTFLFDLGVKQSDGELRFKIENCPAGTQLKRIAAYFHFTESCVIQLPEEGFKFELGEEMRLFFSYRHTPERIGPLLDGYGIKILDEWITQSGEEGVFLCRKAV